MRARERAPLALIALVGLAALSQACGADETQTTADVPVALLSNSPYKYGTSTLTGANSADPAAVVFNNKAIFAYARTDGTIQVLIESNLGSGTGQSVMINTLADKTISGVSLVPYNGTLRMFYTTSDGVYTRESDDGISWVTPTVKVGNGQVTGTPAPVVWDGTLILYLVQGIYPGSIVQWNLDSTGTSLAGVYAPGSLEYSNQSLGATVMNGVLYLAWAGTDGSNPIYIKQYTDANGWSADTIIANNWGRPSLFPISPSTNTLELVYRGNNSLIYSITTTNGMTFTPPVQTTHALTNARPAPFEGSSYTTAWTFYVGQNGQLYTAVE